MPIELAYRSSVSVRIPEQYSWIDSARFTVDGTSAQSQPQDVLQRLLVDEHYVNAYQLAERVAGEVHGRADHYETNHQHYLRHLREQGITPEADPMRQSYPELWSRNNAPGDEHGPYQMSCIGSHSFELLDGSAGRNALVEWIDAGWEDDASQLTIEGDLEVILEQLAAATVVFRLSDLGEEAQHAGGLVVDPYLELVIIDLHAGVLHLVAAGGD